MVKQFNASANFTNINNTEFDSGLKMLQPSVLAYALEENSGTDMLNIGTASGNGTRDTNLTRVVGAVAGRYATQGDGTHYNAIPWRSDFRNDFTWEFFIKPSSYEITTDYVGILGAYNTSGNSRHFLVCFTGSGKISIFYSANGSNLSSLADNTALVADTWYHVRISYGATGGLILSIDGVERKTASYIGDLYDFNDDYYLFTDNGNGSLYEMQGALADVRFHDEVLPSTYSTPDDYYRLGESLIHDSGELYSDPAYGFAFDNSTATETATSLTLEYQYADYASPQSWSTASDVNDNAAWSGSWLTLAQIQAETDPITRTYRYLKTRITGTGSLTEFSIDTMSTDITPPTDVSATANAAFSGATSTYDLVATFTGGTDTGGSGYAGANLEIEEGGVSYFQQSDGSFLADETFANLLFKGEAGGRSIIYALGRSEVPTRFRINAWDEAENYNRGEWHDFYLIDEVDYPDETDVRFGVDYENGDKTGSAYIPQAANVRETVPVDDTVGTLHVPNVSPDDVRAGVDY